MTLGTAPDQGDLLALLDADAERVKARLLKLSEQPSADACWRWTAQLDRHGYGLVSIGPRAVRKRMFAHRVAFHVFRGPVPTGLDLDHLCRVRECINPDHLEPVTRGENTRRGLAPIVTRERYGSLSECKHGHPRTPENVRVNRDGSRACRACERIRFARYAAKKKAG